MKQAKDIPLDPLLYQRFLKYLELDESLGCLLWRASLTVDGYGQLTFQGKTYRTHRIAYCFGHNVMNLPEGYELDHTCHTVTCSGGATCLHRRCCELTHLEAVTPRVNNLRGRSPDLVRARRLTTVCIHGHAKVGENLFIQMQGNGWLRQRCRICWEATIKRATQARKERKRLRRNEGGGA
jgi:hypothetical protein